jgi:hypothetical protein
MNLTKEDFLNWDKNTLAGYTEILAETKRDYDRVLPRMIILSIALGYLLGYSLNLH